MYSKTHILTKANETTIAVCDLDRQLISHLMFHALSRVIKLHVSKYMSIPITVIKRLLNGHEPIMLWYYHLFWNQYFETWKPHISQCMRREVMIINNNDYLW